MGFFGTVREALKNVAKPEEVLEEHREVVDRLVEEKLSAARQVADSFVGDKVQELKTEAWMMIDMLEKRLDAKLAEMEKLIDERLQKEIYWKLVGLRWTLIFVLITSLVGIGYTFLRNYIDDDAPAAQEGKADPGSSSSGD